MKRIAAAFGVVTMSVWATTGAAQGRNFAGTWAYDEARSNAARGLTGSTVAIATNATDGATNAGGAPPMTVAFDSTSFSWGPNTYKIGGTTSLPDKMRGGTVAFRATWKEDKMVVEELAAVDGPVVSTIAYYLEGQSLVREYSKPTSDGSAPRVSKTYYKRVKTATAS
jgi:hypothetical protein